MRRRRIVGNQCGQSIVEYLVVGAAVLAAVLAIRGLVQTQASNLGNASAGSIGAAAQTVSTTVRPTAQ